MATKLETLEAAVRSVLGDSVVSLSVALGEITVVVAQKNYLAAMLALRDDQATQFDELMDLCGVDYMSWGEGVWEGARFAAVSHLLSTHHNWRLRVRVFAPDDDVPVIPSLTEIWNGANWYERECFDLYGILFEGHNDLRRILTDYGFIGHPFRKDFPVTGYVEMRYDPEQRRVIYQPVTIDPREITPRIIREELYGEK